MSEERSAGDPHGSRVSAMFGRIAGWYDFLNHFLSFGQDIYWRHRMVRHVRIGSTGRVLDLAAGTLDVSLEIHRRHPTASVVAMDFALPMLQKGRGKVDPVRMKKIQPVCADGKRLPLPGECVDTVTIAFGIRNILPRQEAYAELLRVLTPGGRLCILEFGSGKGRIWRGAYNFYLNQLLPWLGRLISRDPGAYGYLARTIREFPAAEDLGRELLAAGFSRVAYYPLCSGIVYVHLAEKAPPG